MPTPTPPETGKDLNSRRRKIKMAINLLVNPEMEVKMPFVRSIDKYP